MIISPPFILPVVKEDEKYTTKKLPNDPVIVTPTDDEITEAAMYPTASSLIGGTGIEEGTFPVSNHLMWHNGIHLQARDAGSHDYPIHAIADGEVVFVRKPNPMCTDELAGQYYDESWTDNGCIVLKHTTEIGADGDQPVSITYYSVYMHLVRILIAGGVGKKVYRKDKLGVAGQIYGHTKQLHFEICCDTENLKKIIGREPGWLDPEAIPTKDGRTDSIFGSLYIYLSATTPIRIDPPTDHLRAETDVTLGTAQWIKLDYGSEGRMPGTCALTSYSTSGQWGATRQDINAEYNLYKEATDRHNSLIKTHPTVKSSPSGWYELLRFGRNIGRSETDKDPLPDDAAHWRKIRTLEGKVVWADLNAPGTYKFSDADFLPQFGWNCYDDDTNPNDQRCDSERIKALIRAEGDQPNPDRNKDDVNLSRRLGDKDVRKAMRRAICKFPCEWDKHAMVERYEWLKEVEYGYKDNPEGWTEYVNHLRAMTFDGLPQEYTDAQWRFHPTEFIKHFRKCGWRSLRELVQTMPRKSSGGAGGDISWDDAWKRWEQGNNKHGYMPPGMNIAINRMWTKYGFFTVRRQTHFLAQIYKETGALRGTSEDGDKRYLRTMYEVLTPDEAGEDYDQKRSWLEAMGFLKKRNRQNYVTQRPDEISKKAKALGNVETGDGSRFRGRGLIHLTGRVGYSAYEKYRSRNFTTDLNAQLLSTDSMSAADSAGYFWVSKMMDSSNTGALRNGLNIHRRADIGTDNANVAAVTTTVTGGKTGLSERQEFFEYALFILGDSTEMSDKLKIKMQNDK